MVFQLFGEYTGVIVFYGLVFLLVYLNRHRFEKHGSLMYLYKTQFGIKFMKKVSRKFRKPIKILGYTGIVAAYIGFFFVVYILFQAAYDIIADTPGAVGGSPVIPGLPIAGLGIRFPLLIGWISLFIIMIVHEFAHGIMAKAHNIKIKSSGIAFFGPILGAFVEPDEERLEKKSHKVQHSIFAAGPVSNAVLWIVCIMLMVPVGAAIVSMTTPQGVTVRIIQYEITNITSLENALAEMKPRQKMTVRTNEGSYNLTALSHPDNSSKAYIGIWIYGEDRILKDNTVFHNAGYSALQWILELLVWTAFISINIALINLFPVFITDGARMLKLNFEMIFRDKEKAAQYWVFANSLGLTVVLILLFFPLIRTMLNLFIGFIISF